MNNISAIFYGILQGVTEFLPVSSSGHLNLLQNVFKMENVEAEYFTFNILLHLSTLFAVFIVYWKDIIALIPSFFTMMGKVFKGKFKRALYTENERFVFYIIIATVPLVLAVFVKDYIEALGNYPKVIGGILIFNGLVLFISDKLSNGKKKLGDIKASNAMAVGLCQMCAIVPGLSRSGSTITGGLTQGFERELAVKFSFILSIPAILGANILEIPDMFENPIPSGDVIPYALGMAAALLSGIAAMKLLQYISKKSNFRVFSYYCAAVGILALIFA